MSPNRWRRGIVVPATRRQKNLDSAGLLAPKAYLSRSQVPDGPYEPRWVVPQVEVDERVFDAQGDSPSPGGARCSPPSAIGSYLRHPQPPVEDARPERENLARSSLGRGPGLGEYA